MLTWIFTKKSVEEHFTTIFEKRRWPKGFPETVSGAGSTLRNTEMIRARLVFLRKILEGANSPPREEGSFVAKLTSQI
jgi:hypothetical protein